MGRVRIMIVVVDADAIVAQIHTSDSNHSKAVQATKLLKKNKARVLYPRTAIIEAVTVLQTKLNDRSAARGTALYFTNPNLEIIETNSEIYSMAFKKYFISTKSKRNTLFDCIVVAIAEEYDANAIFSFDKFYEKKGFKLASEL